MHIWCEIGTAMIIKENKSEFENNQLIRLAKRENNKKRSFLIVNPSQGKHIPVSPYEPLRLFRQLAEELKKYISCEQKDILFIGFAETATAIGTGIALCFPDSDYMNTTREIIDGAEMIAEFQELHSHAVGQTLQCTNWNSIIKNKKHIIFAEDEISTGTTIMNFVNALRENKKVPENIQFSVISVINAMTPEREAELAEKGIVFRYLMKISMTDYKEMNFNSYCKDISDENSCKKSIEYKEIDGYINAGTGIKTSLYKESLDSFCQKFKDICKDVSDKHIVVTGTEEFMFPAIYAAACLQKDFPSASVLTHSTTRSPIEPHEESGYPVFSRATLKSFYDKDRITYIYNTKKAYDKVIVITDSKNSDITEAACSFAAAFPECNSFTVIRWVRK